jgi:hypothetical protein
MTTYTVQQILEIAGAWSGVEFSRQGKWLVSDQRGSKGVMNTWVARLKEAGIPAFFNATDRTWGVLAEKVQQ